MRACCSLPGGQAPQEEGAVGWLAEVQAKHGATVARAKIKVFGSWFKLTDKERIASVVQNWEDSDSEATVKPSESDSDEQQDEGARPKRAHPPPCTRGQGW